MFLSKIKRAFYPSGPVAQFHLNVCDIIKREFWLTKSEQFTRVTEIPNYVETDFPCKLNYCAL